MPTKIFTLLGGKCPFGCGHDIDSSSCRKCQWFYRTGTGTFFWCSHPIEQKSPEIAHEPTKLEQKPEKIARKAPQKVQPKRKRGRPPGKAKKKAVKTRKTKNG